jgi:23S rRNA (guanosine2251-2'-O)-methyltransferase
MPPSDHPHRSKFKKSFASGGRRDDRDPKPFHKKTERGDKPFAKKGDRDPKTYYHKDHRDPKPFAKSDDGERKPFYKKDSRDAKPFAKRDDRDPRPFYIKKDSRDVKSFSKRDDGEGKSFRRRDDRDNGRKPYVKKDIFRKPYKKSERPPQAAAATVAPVVRFDTGDTILIWGLHAVKAAWLNPKRRCHRLWLTDSAQNSFEPTIAVARDELLLKRPDSKKVDRQELDKLTPPGSVHQGVVLQVSALPEPALSDIIAVDNPPDLLLMLDQVTDPHNVGAILRSASAFGAGAVIMTERNAPSATGVLAKAASGALETVPQIHVVNLARSLDELRQAGYWCVGLAEEGERDLGSHDLTGRTVLVLGAEGEGLRQLTRKKCDELAKLPTGGDIGSLNVSNAAAVGLYEVRRQKKKPR